MKKLTILFVLLLISPFICVAQKAQIKPDFSGTWVLDEKKSKIADGYWNYELNITHTEPEIRIAERRLIKGQNKSANVIYYTDKRGEKNPSHFYEPEIESATSWKDNSIVRKYKILTREKNKFQSETIETYTLSKDQKTLTVTVDRFSLIWFSRSILPIEGRVIQKFVYKRQ